MTVKLWGVDRLHLHFVYIILNPIHSLFSAFCSKYCLFLFLFMKLTHIQVFKKECMKLE